MTVIPSGAESYIPGEIDSAETFSESDVTVRVPNNDVSPHNGELGLNFPQTSFDPYLSSSDGGGESQSKDIDFTGHDTYDCYFDQSGTYASIEVFIDGNSVFYDSGGSSCTYSHDISGMTGVHTVKLQHSDRYSGDGSGEYVDCDTDTLGQTITSGTAYVEWPYPNDVYDWGSIFFEEFLDGETLDVYVEEYSGSWTEIAGPVSNGDGIPANPTNNVRFRIEISRASTGNNPVLKQIKRQEVFM